MGQSEFYNIARETARIIHEKSYEGNGILQVMLYGSTLHNDNPKDIDLLVIHDGRKLVPYFVYRKLQMTSPPGVDNARMFPFDFLEKLGYREGGLPEDGVLANVERLVSPRSVNDVYDFNALDAFVLSDENGLVGGVDMFEARGRFMGALGVNRLFVKLLVNKLRGGAIQSCKETNFWHTILSEGKVYDTKSGDFSIGVNDLYPDVLRFFPSTPDTSHREN